MSTQEVIDKSATVTQSEAEEAAAKAATKALKEQRKQEAALKALQDSLKPKEDGGVKELRKFGKLVFDLNLVDRSINKAMSVSPHLRDVATKHALLVSYVDCDQRENSLFPAKVVASMAKVGLATKETSERFAALEMLTKALQTLQRLA